MRSAVTTDGSCGTVFTPTAAALSRLGTITQRANVTTSWPFWLVPRVRT